MAKSYEERDKQINARIKPNLHSKLKEVSQTRDIILSTLIEKLLEIGLKHYLEENTGIDTSRYLTKDDLTHIEDTLGKLESQILDIVSLADSDRERVYRLQRLFAISSSSQDKNASPVENENIPNLATDTPIVGSELSTKEMLQYTKSNPSTKNAGRDILRGLKAYPEEVWEPIARGYWKRIK